MSSYIKELYSLFLQHSLISTDTRVLKKDSLFFALKGENFNGNKFASQALEGGCSIAIIDEEKYKQDERYFLVPDVLLALQALAKFHRQQLAIPVIAITGSNGKTTSKELIFSVLSQKYNTCATQGNLNNHIGVPLTLLSIKKEHEMAVVEMGANHVGEIKELCDIAQPDFGIITNIGKAHLEGFGGFQGVIKAKKELYDFIGQHQGIVFVNSDNSLLSDLSRELKTISYGTSANCYCMAALADCDPYLQLKWKLNADPLPLEKKQTVNTQLIGSYNFENVLAAACIGSYFKVEEAKISKALENYLPTNNRSQVLKKNSNEIFLDAYNANPTSMHAAIENFSGLSGSQVIILGDMLELGTESNREHQLIIELIKSKNFLNVILVGKYFSSLSNIQGAKLFENSDDAFTWLKQQSIINSRILIKGSRGIKLEKLVDAL